MSDAKDTIYIDIDDEITAIIDKVRSSDGRIVALVLPKRATVFQSVVNMKLLKRTAEAAHKHLVLVTTEAGLMPLAGAVGLHVAKTPQSKPEIPAVADTPDEADEDAIEETALDDEPSPEFNAENAGSTPVGELAKAAGTGAAAGAIETVALDEAGNGAAPAAATTNTAGKSAMPKGKNKKLKVPSFNKFRALLVIGGIVVVLIIFLLYICLVILPKATIAISTNASNVNVAFTMTLDTDAPSLDTAQQIVPAKTEQEQKTANQQVNTTGQQNNGDPATGQVTMSAKACAPNLGQPDEVPAGTGISVNGLTYITQEDTHFSPFGSGQGSCATYNAMDSTTIKSQTPGAKYNVSDANFTVAGRSDVSANGSAAGGTDDIIKVVAQADIDAATKKINAQDTGSVKSDLEQELRQDGLYPIDATFKAGDPVVTTSSNVGDQADTVTVTQATTYTMFGAKQSDIETLLKSDIKGQVDTSKQSILDDGLDNAEFKLVSSSGGNEQVSVAATGTVGPDINEADIKKMAAGKKSGDVIPEIENQPGVTNVNIHLSPFWVGSIPKKTSKITVTVGKVKPATNGRH